MIWHKIKKSSKAADMPTIKEKSPTQRARMAHPLKRFAIFLMLDRLSNESTFTSI